MRLDPGRTQFVLLELPGPVAEGTPLRARLQVSEGAPIELAGVVRHTTAVAMTGPAAASRHYLVGVQFQNVGAEIRAQIERILDDEQA